MEGSAAGGSHGWLPSSLPSLASSFPSYGESPLLWCIHFMGHMVLLWLGRGARGDRGGSATKLWRENSLPLLARAQLPDHAYPPLARSMVCVEDVRNKGLPNDE